MTDAATILYGGTSSAPVPASAPTSTPAAASTAPAPVAKAPGPATASAPAQSPGPTQVDTSSPDSVREALRSVIPKDVATARTAPARTLYSPQVEHADTVTAEHLTASGMSPQVAEVVASEVREMLSDLGLTKADAKEMIEAMGSHDPKADVKTQQAAIEQLLRREFGDNWKTATEEARRTVARDPRVANLLSNPKFGLFGNNPRVVLAICRGAMRQRGLR